MKKHGLCGRLVKHPLYNRWRSMKFRCSNPNAREFHNYGARGITVCERWLKSFPAFVEDVGPCPGAGYTLDRRDNNGNYEPGNMRWTTQKEQMRNQRKTRRLIVEGIEYTARALAEISGLKPDTIMDRAQTMTSLAEILDPMPRTWLHGTGLHNRQKTHCVRGHEFNEANTYNWKHHRICRACMKVRRRKI